MAVEPGAQDAPADRLRKLQRVSDAALAHLQLDDLLNELLERLREIFSADTSAFLLLEEGTNELVARAARGIEEEVERGVRIPVGKGFAGRIAAERRAIVIEDVDHADILNPILREKGIKSLLGAPLITRGRVLGVLHVGTLHPRTFRPDEVDLVQFAADRAAMGIDRALVHDELRRLAELRHRFVSTASHELRTPISAVLGAVSTLDALGDRLTEEQRAELNQILRSETQRLATLVDQLLDVSRLDAEAVSMNPVPLDLRNRVTAIVAGLQGGSEVIVDIDPSLRIVADPVAVDRVVTNLVVNALRHGAPPVHVTALMDEAPLRIVVEDRGNGVAAEFQNRLFEQFARSADSRGTAGSGLGLAIARSYARAHGGDLRYEDAQPRGARFEFVLPAAAA